MRVEDREPSDQLRGQVIIGTREECDLNLTPAFVTKSKSLEDLTIWDWLETKSDDDASRPEDG